MDIQFFPSAPHAAARHALDHVLWNGTRRVMIACAFCTEAGLAIMRPHVSKLLTPGSCLVVSADDPTDIDAVNDLAMQAPGAVWMHKTGKLPYEKKVGSALMHSKVFYSESEDECRLWVGSHNLTARATAGANLEAALLLTGHPSEPPFQAARQHVEDCRNESWPCPVEPPVLPDGEAVDTVLVHAETEEVPSFPTPWRIGLGVRSPEYDWSLGPPAAVRLYLYRPGDLAGGWRHAAPLGAYGGRLTG